MSLSRPERSILVAFTLLIALAGCWAIWPWRGPAEVEPAPVDERVGGPAGGETTVPGDPVGVPPMVDDIGDAAGGEAGTPYTGARPGGASVVVIHIVGAVASPGVYALREGQRVADAVAVAGGVAGDARVDLVNLAARLEDGQKIYIPSDKDARAGGGQFPWEGGGAGTGVPAKVSLNRAGVAELDTLPGIGPALAQRIVDYRREHGPFRRLEDLQQVPGIGPAKFQEVRSRLTLN